MNIIDVIKSGDFMVLDTETTGLNHHAEIVSIAIIDAKGTPRLNTLVKPVRPIPPDATRIHGITNDMVANCDPFPNARVYELLAGRHVIVYNVGYDLAMLYQSAEMANQPFVEWSDVTLGWHCAMQHFSPIYGEWNEYHGNYRWQRLTTAARYYGISTEGAHGALADCLMTLKVCQKMAEGQ